jgi:hypothetical protein
VPYAIDFLNPAPDFERDRHHAALLRDRRREDGAAGDRRALSGKPSQSWPRWAEMTGSAGVTDPCERA